MLLRLPIDDRSDAYMPPDVAPQADFFILATARDASASKIAGT
jgi:hypothetical protein